LVAPIMSTLQYWRHEYEALIREAETCREKELPMVGAARH